MKILFYTERSLGQKGNAGTYLLIQAFSEVAEVLSVSNPVDKHTVLTNVGFETAFLDPDIDVPFDAVSSRVESFDPDVVYLFNHDGWWATASRFKAILPRSKIVFDVKTPLLKKEKNRVQSEGQRHQVLLDHVFSLSISSVYSWIPGCDVEITEYPLGVDVEKISKLQRASCTEKIGSSQRTRFVYIGALAKVRDIESLVEGFLDYANGTGGDVTLDIYGSGEPKELRDLVRRRDQYGVITFKGLVDVDTLFEKLPYYDVGIAWVPKKLFSESPSLKVLEYAAARLKIMATDTIAHLKLIEDGYRFGAHEDTREGVRTALENKSYLHSDVVLNRSLTESKNYNQIVKNILLPRINEVANSSRKIGFIVVPSLAAGKGGAEKVATQLCGEMATRGIFIFIVYFSRTGVDEPSYGLPPGVIALRYRNLDAFRNLLASHRPDFCFCFIFNRDVLGLAKIAIAEGVSFGYQECTNPERLVGNNWKAGSGTVDRKVALWEREVLAANSSRVRLVMPRYKDSYPKNLRGRIFAFSNACPSVDTSVIHNMGLEYKYIVSINGLKRNKNFLTLLNAFLQVRSQFPGWKLVDVGKNANESNDFHKSVINFIEANCLQDDVVLHGPSDDINWWLYNSEFHVISSLSEGCPTVVLEAMACGIPSVGFVDCPGTNELISHERDGLLVGAEDRVSGMAEALRVLAGDEVYRHKLGREAALSAKRYEEGAVYDTWQRLFEEMADEKINEVNLQSPADFHDREAFLHSRRMLDLLEV